MAARKLQQEVDKCFKKVAEGVAEFEGIYEKIEQSNNPAQKEKLEDNLKREIKKLQRLRDQIKTWAASNDIKDKAPLLDHRRLIETQMEKFKAVEKAMKTKAYSKEGLSAAAKLDPKEQAKLEAGEFLSNMVDELEQQIEALEAEGEQISSTMKKGKNQATKAERIADIETTIETHKWQQGKMELMRRSLENGRIQTDDVMDMEDIIRMYVTENQNPDFHTMYDEEMYDHLGLEDDEDAYGMNHDNEKGSSHDTQSMQEEPPQEDAKPVKKAPKEADAAALRRPSGQTKSPLPALATLHTPLPTISNGSSSSSSMKPATVPQRPAEGLKYASAAAAAAASDKNNVGIAPLPPPPGSTPVISPLPPIQGARTSAASSPAMANVQPVQHAEQRQPTPLACSSEPDPIPTPARLSKKSKAVGKSAAPEPTESKAPQTNGVSNGIKRIEEEAEEECYYHLPSSLHDLVDSYETSRKRQNHAASSQSSRLLATSQATNPDAADADAPSKYRPEEFHPATLASGFPKEPLPLLDDQRLYSRLDPDTLFYLFYYKQGTPQQYLAAKALKEHSWRFHKQYQTWFQRHEEPKNITEEFEQGTYRFFDYESTWMNRRKADFKFAYKFLEDDI